MPMLKNVIILSSMEMYTRITEILKDYSTNLNLVPVVYAKDFQKFNRDFLKNSRIISFLSNQIVPAEILNHLGFGGVNFHPGTPNFPGWQAWQFALYEGVSEYGITVHWMEEKVDSGKIIAVKNFTISHVRSEQELGQLCINKALNFLNLLKGTLLRDEINTSSNLKWTGTKTTKADYKRKCELSRDVSQEELTKIIRSFGNGDGYSKPNIVLDNVCYELVNGKNIDLNRPFIKLHHYLFAQKY
jgi:methionyl-tRNA formyltransferase